MSQSLITRCQLVGGYVLARLLFFPTLLRNVLLESSKRRWFDRIDKTVVLGAFPFKSQTELIVTEERVRTVVSMNESYELKLFCNSKEEWAKHGVKQVHLPVIDFFFAPSRAQLQEAVSAVRMCRQTGSSAYVHCKAGRGRSATVVACYLMEEYGYLPEEAFREIKAKRPHAKLCAAQWNAVFDYHRAFCQ